MGQRFRSSQSGSCAIEETIPSGWTRARSTSSGRNLPPRASGSLRPLVLVEAVEIGTCRELVERPGQIQVREDPPGLLALVCASEQDGVDVHADELETLEVVEDPRHRQGEHALPMQGAR